MLLPDWQYEGCTSVIRPIAFKKRDLEFVWSSFSDGRVSVGHHVQFLRMQKFCTFKEQATSSISMDHLSGSCSASGKEPWLMMGREA